MSTFTDIAEFLARPNTDAIDWHSARDGDVVMRTDPSRRHEGAYVISGVPTYDARNNLVTWCVPHDGIFSSSVPSCRVFADGAFQVWRDFDAATPAPAYVGADGGPREVIWIDSTDDEVCLKVRVPQGLWSFVIAPKSAIKSGKVVLP